MTKDEFEQKYATDSGLTVEELRKLGFVAEVCDCKEEICNGWKYTPTEQEAVNFNNDYENRYINKFFEGRSVARAQVGSHYHTLDCLIIQGDRSYIVADYKLYAETRNYQGKTYSPHTCCRLLFEKEFCCNKWWDTLTEEQKMWIHYYVSDIGITMLQTNRGSVEELHDGIVKV